MAPKGLPAAAESLTSPLLGFESSTRASYALQVRSGKSLCELVHLLHGNTWRKKEIWSKDISALSHLERKVL